MEDHVNRCSTCGAKAAPATAHLHGTVDRLLCWSCYQARLRVLELVEVPVPELEPGPVAVEPELRRIHERMFKKAA